MNPNILHVGLDVDDTQCHGTAFDKATGEVIDFKCRPVLKGLVIQLGKLQRHFRGLSIRLCQEASWVGYFLQRDLRARRQNAPPELIQIADRCLRRLNKTANPLLDAEVETEIGKPTSSSPEPTVPEDRLWSPRKGRILMR